MQKKVMSLFLSLVLLCSLGTSAMAAARWGETAFVGPVLCFSGTTAVCSVSVTGVDGTSLMRVTTYLQRQTASGGWENVETWYKEVHGAKYSLKESVPGCVSGHYRLTVNATVYDTFGNGEPAGGEATATL